MVESTFLVNRSFIYLYFICHGSHCKIFISSFLLCRNYFWKFPSSPHRLKNNGTFLTFNGEGEGSGVGWFSTTHLMNLSMQASRLQASFPASFQQSSPFTLQGFCKRSFVQSAPQNYYIFNSRSESRNHCLQV